MSLIQGNLAKSAAGDFYSHPIEQSLRFNDDDSAYLSRTPASAGNRKTWTWSGWVKRGNIDVGYVLFSDNKLSNFGGIRIHSNGFLRLNFGTSASNYYADTAMLFRDTSAWYHIVCVADTSNATSTDRLRVYVNGVRQTLSGDFPSQNFESDLNSVISHSIGINTSYPSELLSDGYMAEVHFIDGTALDASSFGETKSGVWIPKAYAGSYGTNGFYLDFGNSGSIGADVSGNGNNFTANNLAATDVVLDSPTNNFCTLNPANPTNCILGEGNLKTGISNGSLYSVGSTFTVGSSQKWYWETCIVTDPSNGYPEIGLLPITRSNLDNNAMFSQDSSGTFTFETTLGHLSLNGTFRAATYTAASLNDVMMFAYDASTRRIWIGLNGTWFNSGNPSAGTGYLGTLNNDWGDDLCVTANGYTAGRQTLNFGQDSSFAGVKTAQGNTDANGYGDFYYAPPTGYLALCTANLEVPDAMNPALDNSPQDYFNTVLYTGNGSSQSITGVGLQPSWTWIKRRDSAAYHHIYDAIRGGTKVLYSNATDSEQTSAGGLTSFDSDGFSIGNHASVNTSGGSYVAWNWKANGSGVSNTDGSITSTVSANTDAGFSIVSWVGTEATATVGHGLNSAPEMIIVKDRDTAYNWVVYSESIGNTNYLRLNTTDASATYNMWNNTSPTSSVFSLSGYDWVNNLNDDMIAYCFHSVEGFSKFGSYTGNGSTDGTFVYTGFRPAFLLIKRTDGGTNNWVIYDKERDPYNYVDDRLYPNLSSAESGGGASYSYDFLSNGFKLRSIGSEHNISGGTYIYMAFAENPFKYSTAR